MPAATWAAAATPIVDARVELRHVSSLYLGLDDALAGGSWTDGVAARFRAPLADADAAALARAAPRLELSRLLPALREFAREQLADGARWDAAGGLKEYLGYAGVDTDEVAGFEDAFPDSIALAQTVAAYELLLAAHQGSS